jgi:cytochrome c peroxidase
VTARTRIVERAFHNTGLHNPVPEGSEGIAAFTLRPEDTGRFRTPSLRNVAATAPYMHDGSVATLSDVLDNYAKGGRFPDTPGKAPLVMGFALSDAEKADVIEFLQSLTDEDFLTDPRFADPWPEGHPASATRMMP